jgi:hypothetical protein
VEAWQKVFREGLAPLLSTKSLEALRKALVEDDPRLLQGVTTQPPPLQCVQDWPVEGCCLVGFAGWQGDGLETVAEVEEFFARMCYEMDMKMGEPAACRWLLNDFDDRPREEMRRLYLTEVQRALAERLEKESEEV